MATRQHAREAVVSLLYAYACGNGEIAKHAEEIFESKKIRNRQREFAQGLFDGVMQHIGEIDHQITEQLKEWEFHRIGDMEKSILRLGFYEIAHSDTDNAVIINESVELAKTFGNENSPKFVNGILDGWNKKAKDSHSDAALHSA